MIHYPPIQIIELFKKTHGAMSVAEGIALYNVCLKAPGNEWVELGSHKAKSSIMILASKLIETRFTMVEPEFKSVEWSNEVASTLDCFALNNVRLCSNYSTEVLPSFDKISFLFVDSGDHGEEIVQSEKPLYENKIVSGGVIAFHDFGSQFTAVSRCYEQLIASGNYEPIGIDWNEIFIYVAAHQLEEGNDSWHQYPELPHPPNFIGALKRK